MNTVRERYQAGAAYATSCKKTKALDAMLAAVRRMNTDREVIAKSAVSRESGVSRKTVITRWADLELALSTVEGGCVNRPTVKKGSSLPATDEDANRAGDNGDAAAELVEPDQTAVVADCPSEVDDTVSRLIATDSDTRTVEYGAGTPPNGQKRPIAWRNPVSALPTSENPLMRLYGPFFGL
jgi:hypothetical protein